MGIRCFWKDNATIVFYQYPFELMLTDAWLVLLFELSFDSTVHVLGYFPGAEKNKV